MGLIADLLASCRKGVVGEPEGRRGERETIVSHRSLLNGMSKQTLALPVSSQSPGESTPGPCSEGGGKVGKVRRHPSHLSLGRLHSQPQEAILLPPGFPRGSDGKIP